MPGGVTVSCAEPAASFLPLAPHLGTSTAGMSLSSAQHKWLQLTTSSCQAFRKSERTLSRRNSVYQGRSPCAHVAEAKTMQTSHPCAPQITRACRDTPASAGQPSSSRLLQPPCPPKASTCSMPKVFQALPCCSHPASSIQARSLAANKLC